VYTRWGTCKTQAARFPSNPAFGVLKSVIRGRKCRKILHTAKKDSTSANGEIPRRIGSGHAATPSSRASLMSDSPGAETSVTSNPANLSALRRPLSTRHVWSLVTPITRRGLSAFASSKAERIDASESELSSEAVAVIAEYLQNPY
jgi:hypothetical protein